MTDDLLSARVIVVSAVKEDHDLFRQTASASTVPIEILEADGAAAACRWLGSAVDLVFLDAALASEEIGKVVAVARSSPTPPFTAGFSGLETMVEFRREKRNPFFVLITSTPDQAIAERARGAAFLKKRSFRPTWKPCSAASMV